MNGKRISWWAGILVTLLLVLSCSSLSEPATVAAPASATPLPESTLPPAPTSTPEPTDTPAPTPTNTPVPVGSVLSANGFEVDPAGTCDEPCQVYKYGSDMAAQVYENGNFTMYWMTILGRTGTSQKLESVFKTVIRALYPADVAEAVIGVDFKHSGEIGGFAYDVHTSGGDGFDMIFVSVVPIP